MKAKIIHLAECVAALWQQASNKHESLPDVNGVIDKAIEQVYREIPELRESLTFSNTAIGRRCLEWSEAASYLQVAGIAEVDGATFTRLSIKLSGTEVYRILYEQGLSKGQRKRLSSRFYDSIKKSPGIQL